MNYFRLILIFILFSHSAKAQEKKAKWTNKNNGTYSINFHHIGIYPKNDIERGIPNEKLIGISVKVFELSDQGCIQIEGNISINGKEYFAYDSTKYADEEGFKDPTRFFGIWASEGTYVLSANVGSEFYPVKQKNSF